MAYIVKETHKSDDEYRMRTDLEDYWLECNGEIVLWFGPDGNDGLEVYDELAEQDGHDVKIDTRTQMLPDTVAETK